MACKIPDNRKIIHFHNFLNIKIYYQEFKLINDITMNTKGSKEICHLLWSVVTFVSVSCCGSTKPESLLSEWNITCQILIIGHLVIPSSLDYHLCIRFGKWIEWIVYGFRILEVVALPRAKHYPLRPQLHCITGKVPQP